MASSISPVLAATEGPASDLGGQMLEEVWVWADEDEGSHPVFMAIKKGDEWLPTETISTGEAIDLVPAIAVNTKGEYFVVWSSHKNGRSELRFRYLLKEGLNEQQDLYTGLDANTSPSAGFDASDTLWLCWAGFNGISDEIYFATLSEDGTTTPEALTNNEVPDVQPVLGFDQDTGYPWISWLQYSDDGYQEQQISWDGESWSAPISLLPADKNQSEEQDIAAKRHSLLELAARFEADTMPSDADQTEIEGDETTFTKPGQNGELAANPAAAEQTLVVIPSVVTEPQGASVYRPGYPISSHPVRRMTVIE